ncbi:MAG: hypothetical protein JWM29_1777 [Solirubrobacterales bacterium]|nr:hypothetical protein [Solirubrobacterales bacterium]
MNIATCWRCCGVRSTQRPRSRRGAQRRAIGACGTMTSAVRLPGNPRATRTVCSERVARLRPPQLNQDTTRRGPMLFSRKTSFIAVLVAASVGAPPLGRPPVAAHGNWGQPQVVGVAVLPERMRVRRRARFARFRAIVWRVLRRRRQAAARIEAQRPSLSSRRPLRDSYARGPPRGPDPASASSIAGRRHAARL